MSPRVAEERSDVLIVNGGVVSLPGSARLGFDLGLPARTVYPCMAEPIVLALEGRREGYSLGQSIEVDRVHHIARLAREHGFGIRTLVLGQ